MGRLTVSTDRPAEVKYGEQRLGKSPLVDIYVPAGKLTLHLREGDGPWRQLDLEVKKDQVNRVNVKLDSLPTLP